MVQRLWGVEVDDAGDRRIVAVYEDEESAEGRAESEGSHCRVVPMLLYRPGEWLEHHRVREEE